jgi:hypothetical protein
VRRAAALLCALAVALAAGGCGGGNDEEATSLLKRGFATDVETGVMALDAELELEGVEQLDGPLKLRLEGPFRAAGGPTEMPDLDLDFRASGAGQEFTGRVVLTRENAWVEYGGTTYQVGEALWARALAALAQQQEPGAPETLAEAGIDPLDWVEEAETGGEETVDGTQATEITAKIDVESMLRDFNRIPGATRERLSESTLRDAEDVLQDLEIEALVGEDDIWRRISARTEFDIPENERDAVGGLEGGRVELHVQLAQPNEPVEIEGLSQARPIDELLRALQIPPELFLGPGFAQPSPN